MDLATVFERLALPTALIVVLLFFIGIGISRLWDYFTKKLELAEQRAIEAQKEFLKTLGDQTKVTEGILRSLDNLTNAIHERRR